MQNFSDAEITLIKQELKAAVDTLIRGCETLDMDLAFRVFLDAPDFRMIGMDGTLCDYRTYVDNNINYLSACSGFKLTTLNEEIKILDSDTAVFAWEYQAEAVLKTGDRDLIEKAGATFVFSKIGGEWKVVHYHESTLPPVRISGINGLS